MRVWAFECACLHIYTLQSRLVFTGMMAKYQRQTSVKASASTPTGSKSFAKQFSRQQSTQPIDEEVLWYAALHEGPRNLCKPVKKFFF